MVIHLFFFICNRTIRADICASGTSITQKLICLSGTRIGHQFVFCQKSNGFDCCRTGLCYCFWNIFWSLTYTGQENTCCRRFYRSEFCMCFCQEVVRIDTCCQHGRNLTHVRIRFNRSGKNYHICFFQNLLIIQKVYPLHQKLSIWLWKNFSHLTFDIIYTILLYRSSVELIKVLSRCTYIYIKYGYIDIRIFITDQHGMFCSIHTADFRAVALSSVICAAASHTLNKYHLFWCFSIRKTFQMSFGRSRSVHDTFQFQRGNHIFTLIVCIFIVLIQFDGIKPCRHYNCTIFFCYHFILLVVVNRTCLTYFCTYSTFSCFKFQTVLTVDNRNIRDCLCKWCVYRTSVI